MFENLSKTELSKMLGVDRGTIGNWAAQGMPKIESAGKHPGYSASLCIYWKMGHTIATARKIEITPVQKIAVGWLSGFAGDPLAEDEKLFFKAMQGAGLSSRVAYGHLEFARGVLIR